MNSNLRVAMDGYWKQQDGGPAGTVDVARMVSGGMAVDVTDSNNVCLDEWEVIMGDGDPSTVFEWSRWGIDASMVTIKWTIPTDVTPGTYRLCHYGDYKYGWNGGIYPYKGASSTFEVNGVRVALIMTPMLTLIVGITYFQVARNEGAGENEANDAGHKGLGLEFDKVAEADGTEWAEVERAEALTVRVRVRVIVR